MKSLLAIIIFTFSFMSFAGEDINLCNGKATCRKGYIPLLKSGTYHARGLGKTCQQAMDESQAVFMREYGDMRCGLISGPYVWSCTKLGNNRYLAWTKCNPDSGPTRSAPRSNCAMIGGRIFCG